MKLEYLKTAWLVLAMALVFGSLLAGVQITLQPVIAENRRAETFDQVPVLVTGADPEKTTAETIGGLTVYKASDSDGKLLGWVAKATGQGYSGPIDLLIGLDSSAVTITGLFVLSQTETPGLGDFIAGNWRSQFADQAANQPLVVVKTTPAPSGQIEAITGATISSDAVTGIVNKAVEQVRQGLAEQKN